MFLSLKAYFQGIFPRYIRNDMCKRMATKRNKGLTYIYLGCVIQKCEAYYKLRHH